MTTLERRMPARVAAERRIPAHDPRPGDFDRLAEYPFVVVSWIDDSGYPTSVATTFSVRARDRLVSLAPTGLRIPDDRELNIVASHIHPVPGYGYDQRRYVEMWGHAERGEDGGIVFRPTRVWGWDEREVPFFEYSERNVPQSRRYLARLSEERGRPVRPRLSPFWLALRTTRLPFLSATAVPVLLGIAIAATHGAFNPWLALLTLIGSSLAHLAINVTNDVFDTLSGADEANLNPTQFSGGSRVAVYELLTVRQLAILATALFAGAALIGLMLVAITGSLTLLAIGVAGIVVGVAYTAPPLKLVYRGLGEIAVAVGFGPIMLLGAYVVQTGRVALEPLVASIPVAILIALVLYVNEIPDRSGDAAAGKRTLPVRWPRDLVTNAYLAAGLVAFATIAIGVVAGVLPPPALIALLAIPLLFRVHTGIRQHYTSPYTLMAVMGENVKLHLYAGILLLLGYLVTIALMLLR